MADDHDRDPEQEHDQDSEQEHDQEQAAETNEELAARVAELERTVATLEDRLEEQRRTFSLLVADADIEGLAAPCPACGDGTLGLQSGLTWKRAECGACDYSRYL